MSFAVCRLRAKHSVTALAARSMENSLSPAKRRLRMPVKCSSGKSSGALQPRITSSVEIVRGGR